MVNNDPLIGALGLASVVAGGGGDVAARANGATLGAVAGAGEDTLVLSRVTARSYDAPAAGPSCWILRQVSFA